jgi:hypothetical protein
MALVQRQKDDGRGSGIMLTGGLVRRSRAR